jgi:DNA-binding LytR/AlgR family response regulator
MNIHHGMIKEDKSAMLKFSVKRESFIWVDPDKILFIKSADHYVKTLLLHENSRKWTTRHSTLKEILAELMTDQFIRLNKFYVINKKYVSHIDEVAKVIYLQDGFPVLFEHRISPFILSMFRQ